MNKKMTLEISRDEENGLYTVEFGEVVLECLTLREVEALTIKELIHLAESI